MHDVESCSPTGYVSNGRAPTPGKFLHTQKVCSNNGDIWQWDIYDLNGNVFTVLGMCSKNTHLHGSRLSGLRMSTGDVQLSPMGSHCTMGVINLGVAVHTGVKVMINRMGGFWRSKFITLCLQNRN